MKKLAIALVLLATLLAQGCAVYPVAPSLSVGVPAYPGYSIRPYGGFGWGGGYRPYGWGGGYGSRGWGGGHHWHGGWGGHGWGGHRGW
jgi:hypothetical protein